MYEYFNAKRNERQSKCHQTDTHWKKKVSQAQRLLMAISGLKVTTGIEQVSDLSVIVFHVTQ